MLFMSTTLSTKIDNNVYAMYQELSKIRDVSVHNLTKKALERYAEHEIEYERDKAEDMAAYEHYLETGECEDTEKVMSWLKEISSGRYVKWQDWS